MSKKNFTKKGNKLIATIGDGLSVPVSTSISMAKLAEVLEAAIFSTDDLEVIDLTKVGFFSANRESYFEAIRWNLAMIRAIDTQDISSYEIIIDEDNVALAVDDEVSIDSTVLDENEIAVEVVGTPRRKPSRSPEELMEILDAEVTDDKPVTAESVNSETLKRLKDKVNEVASSEVGEKAQEFLGKAGSKIADAVESAKNFDPEKAQAAVKKAASKAKGYVESPEEILDDLITAGVRFRKTRRDKKKNKDK